MSRGERESVSGVYLSCLISHVHGQFSLHRSMVNMTLDLWALDPLGFMMIDKLCSVVMPSSDISNHTNSNTDNTIYKTTS